MRTETVNEGQSPATFDAQVINFLLSVVHNAESHKYGPIMGLNELKMSGVQYAFLNDENVSNTEF